MSSTFTRKEESMFCTIINDCLDANAVGRQGTRVASLLGVNPTFVGVGGKLSVDNAYDIAEIEAAGCLIDVLDGAERREGLVLVNVANRHGKGKKWTNGTPFGYFRYGNTLVVSSVDGFVLSLAKKMGVTDTIKVMDVPTVMTYLAAEGVCSDEVAKRVSETQFRSYDFTPRVGAYLLEHQEVPHEVLSLDSADFFVEIPACAWFVDNFGNVKTTLLPEDIGFAEGNIISTQHGEVKCFTGLKDVPNGETAFTIGSSGIEKNRFVEFVVQGRSAADVYNIGVGSKII